jgi:CHAT domain-containing protein/tetratricopeptide (TPR) repeat protein
MKSLLPAILVASIAAAPAAAAPSSRDSVTAAALQEARGLMLARRWTEADSIVVRALERARDARPMDSGAVAKALGYRANVRLGLALVRDTLGVGYAGQSLAIYGRLARPDSAAWAVTHSVLARLLSERDQPDSALRHLAAARALCVPSGADTLLAELWMITGRTSRRASKPDSALVAFEAARRIRERTTGPRHPSVAAALAELGATLTVMDRYDEARAHLEQAIEMLERSPDPGSAQLSIALGQLASVQHQCGDIAGSIETLERAAAIRARLDGADSPRMIPVRHSIAQRLFDFGDYAGARQRYEALLGPAEAAFGAENTRTASIRLMAGIAALVTNDFAGAERHLTRARATFGSSPPDAVHTDTFLERWYSGLLLHRGDPAGARRVAEAALARERGREPPRLYILSNLLEAMLEACMATGDSAGVDSTQRAMRALFPEGARENTVFYANTLRLLARSEAWRGRRDRAWDLALEAERVERARLQLNVRALPDRRGLELAGGLAEPLDLVVSLARGGDPREIAAAWDRLVRWRGLVAAEVAGRRAPLAATSDTALLAAHRRWIEARRRNAQLEVAGVGATGTGRERLEAGRAAAEEAERRYAAMAAERGIVNDTASVDLALLRAALAEDQALASLVEIAPATDTARFVAFATVGPRGVLHLLDLGRSKEIAPRVAAWRAALALPPPPGRERAEERACRRLGEVVRAITWDVLRPALDGAREVALVAEGDLADLPWQALPVGDRQYLAEAGPAIQTPGAERELLWPPGPAGRGLLAVGDPDFDHAEASPSTSAGPPLVAMRGPLGECGARGALAFEPLPGARVEVAEVVRAWDAAHPGAHAASEVGARATEASFKRDAPGCEVLHVATHGVVWGDSCAPLRPGLRAVGGVAPLERRPRRPSATPPPAAEPQASRPLASPWAGRQVWLALAGANRAAAGGPDENEGLLTADEVVTLDLRGVDWAVLSACRSGLGEPWPREGSIGMGRAFRLAGARTVISSQWSIADESTREWMQALYAERSAGRTRAFEAIRGASRAVLAARRADGRSTHPFYWAAFTSTGP